MKVHTKEFKENIKEFGRELDSKITYTISGTDYELGLEDLNSISPHYQGDILKSVMKQLDIDSNVEIPVGTELNYQFGVKTRSGKNLFNKQTKTDNKVLTWLNATENTENGTIISDYFSKGNLTHLYSNYKFVAFYYNANKTYLGNGNSLVKTATGLSTEAIIPNNDNVAYIRIEWRTGSNNNQDMTVKNDIMLTMTEAELTPYEDYGAYDYIDYGNYIVKEVEKQEDTNSYKITCYDKMLYSMVDYEKMQITYPITIRNYISAICGYLGLTFANSSDQFVNYNKEIQNELYLDANDNSLGYTFRDVLDELAEATASTFYINKDGQLALTYINETEELNLCPPFNKWTLNDTAFIDSNGYLNLPLGGSAYVNINWKKRSKYLYVYYYLADGGCHYIQTTYLDENGQQLSPAGNGNAGNSEPNNVMTRQNFGGNTTYGESINNAQTITLRFSSTTTWASQGYKLKYVMVSDQLLPDNPDYIPYGDIIDEEYLKDVNVNFGEKYGPVNSVVLSRSAGSDNIYKKDNDSIAQNGLCEIKITDNQIMNFDDRDDYLQEIFNKLNGLEYYLNDFSSPGIMYLDLCDRYNVKIGDKYYSCIMLNDEANITQGLEENIYTEIQEQTETDYKAADKTDRKINQTTLLVDKQNQTITARISTLDETLSEVEAILDNQQAQLNVVSTNIDNTSGEIKEVTTTTGFTFNAEGLTIGKSNEPFNTHIDEDSMEHRNGTEIITETSVQGFMTTNLRTKNQHYYGWNGTDYEFVAERVEVEINGNNVDGYGHFYNG